MFPSTQLTLVEEALRVRDTPCRAIFEHAHDAIVVTETTGPGRVVAVNPAACGLFGYSAEEFRGLARSAILDDADPALARLTAERDASGNATAELTYLRKDGSRFTGEVTTAFLGDGAGRRHAVAIIRDVTRVRQLTESLARRNAELEAERMRWQGVVEGIAEEVWVCDADGRMSLINLPEETAMGLEEFEGKRVEEVLEDLDILYADGRVRPAEEAPLLRALRSGRVVRGDEIMRHRASGRVRYRQFSCAPTRDAAGCITGAVAIVRDVTEHRRTEQALREADRRKDEFIAMLSHELRNPLAPIRSSLLVLDRAPPGGDRARRAREVIGRQVAHMAQLVGDLLDVSRLTNGKVRLHVQPLDLAELVSRTLEDHRSLLAARELELVEELERDVRVDADPMRLAQVLGNLLQNAATFTRAGGRVLVRAYGDGGHAVVSVRDTGVGIAPELMAHLFEPFMQADRSLDRGAGGLGLGLALVKGLVELHGGAVQARSDGVGRGAEFTIRLPAAAGRGPARPDPTRAAPRRGRRVLVIEDNADSAESLRDVLLLDAHEVAVAYTGPEGLEAARAYKPEVVLCDIGLPGMDGYGVARALRADPALASVYLVALSGYALEEDVARARAAGFDRHVAKPPDMEELERLIEVMPR